MNKIGLLGDFCLRWNNLQVFSGGNEAVLSKPPSESLLFWYLPLH